MRQKLVDAPETGELDPVDCWVDLGRMHKILAEAYFAAKEYALAVPEAQVGFDILDKYTPAIRDEARADMARRDLGLAAILLGNLAFRTDKVDLGRASFDRALNIFQAQVKARPTNLAAGYNLDKVTSEYGDWCYMKLNKPEEALKYFKMAQQQNRFLCDGRDVVNIMQTGLALGYYRLGLAAEKTGKIDEARKYYTRCLDLREIRLREVEEAFGFYGTTRHADLRADVAADLKRKRSVSMARLGTRPYRQGDPS